MSSGFVSGGTADAPIERSDEWLAAQQELEATRQRKAAEAHQSSGKSLYETLEANKAAKQEAFEEANRLKNQFRALDEDEVDFLDSVLESTRADEARIKRETAEGLELFRKQQEQADKKARSRNDTAEVVTRTDTEEKWASGGRKRKRAKEKEVLKGVKVRRSSSNTDATKSDTPATVSPGANFSVATQASTKNMGGDIIVLGSFDKQHPQPAGIINSPTTTISKAKVGLVNYGSEEDE